MICYDFVQRQQQISQEHDRVLGWASQKVFVRGRMTCGCALNPFSKYTLLFPILGRRSMDSGFLGKPCGPGEGATGRERPESLFPVPKLLSAIPDLAINLLSSISQLCHRESQPTSLPTYLCRHSTLQEYIAYHHQANTTSGSQAKPKINTPRLGTRSRQATVSIQVVPEARFSSTSGTSADIPLTSNTDP